MPKVYVGIVTYNSSSDLPHCIESLRAQTYSNIDITILDNCSQDNTVAWIHEHVHEVHLIVNQENIGFGRAHNQIVRSCNLQPEDYYMPLNPDVILMPEYIAALTNDLEKASAGWGVGKLRLLDQQGQMTNLIYSVGHAIRRDGFTFNIAYHQLDDGQFDTPREIFGAPAAASLIRYSLIRSIADAGELFDADMFMYFEDTDMDWRARLQGWACWYCPMAVAHHRGSSPGQKLRADGLANRYLSVLKNAYLTDLMFYNLPLMFLHCLTRLILTPSSGIKMGEQLIRKWRWAWQKRRRPVIRRSEMLYWFKWSTAQPTGQAKSMCERLRNLRTV